MCGAEMMKARVGLVTSLASIPENKLRLNFRKSRKQKNKHRNNKNKKKVKKSLLRSQSLNLWRVKNKSSSVNLRRIVVKKKWI